MIISNQEFALNALKQIGYYRFTGYAIQFRKEKNNSDYQENVKFENVLSIYEADEELRQLLRFYIEKCEVFYKTLISNEFSFIKCMEEPHNQHYEEKNYYNKESFAKILESLEKEKQYNKDSLMVTHHYEKYNGEMPFWVMVEIMSFSNLSKLFKCMYINDKTEICKNLNVNYLTLENHLHCLTVLRNKCAHGSRLYNATFNPPAKFTSEFYRRNKSLRNNTLFAYILVLMKRLPNRTDRIELYNSLNVILEKYRNDVDLSLLGFPENYDKVLKNII